MNSRIKERLIRLERLVHTPKDVPETKEARDARVRDALKEPASLTKALAEVRELHRRAAVEAAFRANR